MNMENDAYYLRKPEKEDINQLYIYKNDDLITSKLGGFSTGLSMADLYDWLDFHRNKKDEVIWSIVNKVENICVGHIGLYNIDYRIRSAEFAIMIGDKTKQRKGLGFWCSNQVIAYGFNELNLNRISLSFLVNNLPAKRLYEKLRFKEEGRLRQAQYKSGSYHDIILLSLLRHEYLQK